MYVSTIPTNKIFNMSDSLNFGDGLDANNDLNFDDSEFDSLFGIDGDDGQEEEEESKFDPEQPVDMLIRHGFSKEQADKIEFISNNPAVKKALEELSENEADDFALLFLQSLVEFKFN